MRNVTLGKMLPPAIVFALLIALPAFPTARAAGLQSITHLSYLGTGSLNQGDDSSSVQGGDLSLEFSGAASVLPLSFRSGVNALHVPAAGIPRPNPTPIATTTPGLVVGFNGITHREQRRSGTGIYMNTQFSLEPPDQALCVGNDFVLEVINDALRVFSTSGTPLTGTTPVNQFFNLAPQFIRSTPRAFGPFAFDPKCYFDSGTNRFFVVLAELDVVPSTGAFTGKTHELLAVSKTGDPAGVWNLFSIDVTDDGTNGTPRHPNCPCFGDQPLIGADANGFYISTNEFSVEPFGAFFNGAQIYAMSKTQLAGGILPAVVQFNTGLIPFPDAGGVWFSIQPATTPPGDTFATNAEFFLSALDFFGTTDNRIAVWALTGTNTLSSSSPSLSLSHAVIGSEVYGQPPDAQQRDGSRPLGTVIIPILGGKTEKLELLAGNDDRMNQVVFADGKLWAAVNTVVKTGPPDVGTTTVGIAWFIVAPTMSSGGQVGGSIVKQGYVAPQGASVLFPSIGVNPAGKGVMVFTLTGEDFFPSAAYVTIDALSGTGDIHIAGAGALPEDGFTGYHFFGSPDRTARWGDYSAAVADGTGRIWIATEYIPDLPRTLLANWGTFIAAVTP